MIHFRYIVVFVIGLSVSFAACNSETSEPAPSESALTYWEAPQPITVELFEPGVVNSTWPEFAITFTASGDTAYFNRTIKDRSQLAIMRTIRQDGVWQAPDVAEFSGHFFDVDPFVAPGGGVFFSSRQRDPDRNGLESFDHWFWGGEGEPVRLPRPLNSDRDETSISATLDGSIYFNSNRDGDWAIYVSRVEKGARLEPVPVTIPKAVQPGYPLVTPDGETMIFLNDQTGAAKIAFTCKTEEGWSDPQLLPRAINSAYVDFAPAMAPDGTFFFTSERPGLAEDITPGTRPPGDIYTTSLSVYQLCSG